MAEIWTRGARQRQPQGAVAVDWNSPISRDLTFAWNGSNPIYQSIFQQQGIIKGAGSVRPSVQGIAFASTAGSGNGIDFGSSYKPIKAGSTAHTILCLANPVAGATGIRQTLWAQGDDGAAPYRQYTLMADANGAGYGRGVFQFQHYDGAAVCIANSNASLVNGKWHVFVGLRDGTSAKVFLDGKNETNSVLGAFTSSPDTTGPTYISGVSGSSRAMTGGNALSFVWNRALSDAEVAEVSRNPWQLFAPERRVTYFFPASGIPTLSAATAVSIGSTTATPRVTLTF